MPCSSATLVICLPWINEGGDLLVSANVYQRLVATFHEGCDAAWPGGYGSDDSE